MGISGSQRAPRFAQFGVARFGATRFGYYSPQVFVSVDGIQRAGGKATAAHKLEDLVINETTSGSPNTASFKASGGWEPRMGNEVVVKLGSINHTKRLYAGTVLSVDETSIDTPDYRMVQANLVDWTWLLDVGSDKVLGHFTGSATTIALAIMAGAPAGFTTNQVEANLPTVQGGITFTNVDRSVALERLAKRIGAKQRIDYHKDLYFRLTPLATVTSPRPLVVGMDTLKAITSVRRDLSQTFTRVPMEGGGANAAADVDAGDTMLPLTDAPDWWYGDVGGVVIAGPQRISYTGRFAGGGGSLVGTGAAPTSAPVLALAAGSGVDVGAHDVAVVYVTAAGKSLAGPKATITVGTVPAPSTAPTVGTPQSGVGPDAGVHRYAISEVTAAGETTPSPVSADVTTAGLDPPIGAWYVGNGGGGTSAWAAGDTLYIKAVYLSGSGSTTPGPQSASVAIAADPLIPGLAQFRGVYVEASSDPAVTGIRVYVNRNGSWMGYFPFDFPNTTEFYGLGGSFTAGSPPVVNTAQRAQIPLSDLAPASPLGTSRKLWGTAAGDSQLKFIAALNTTDANYLVVTPDSGLGANAPTVNTAAAGQITTSAPLGPASVTQREFYMSPSAGSARKLALTIANNVDIAGTITASNATLAAAAAEPSSDTSGLAQPAGQVLAGATSIPVASLGGADGFQSGGGYAVAGNGQIMARYTGITGNTLTGVPPTGAGSITATIPYNSQITAAPALIGVGDPIVSQSAMYNITGGGFFAGTPSERIGQLFQTGIPAQVDTVRFLLSRNGSPVGNIWATIQTGAIDGTGTVLATSALMNVAAIIGGIQLRTFQFATPVSLEAGVSYYIVLQGDFTRDGSNYINIGGSSVPLASAYKYNGTVVSAATPITAFTYQVAGVPRPIVYPIKKGDPVNLWVTVDDLDAQAALSAALDPLNALGGAAGIRVAPPLQDRRKSRAECLAHATAWLALRSTPNVNLGYRSKDVNTRAGADVVANLIAPTSVNDTFKIQNVTIQNFTPSIPPDYLVQASDDLFSVADLLAKDEP